MEATTMKIGPPSTASRFGIIDQHSHNCRTQVRLMTTGWSMSDAMGKVCSFLLCSLPHLVLISFAEITEARNEARI